MGSNFINIDRATPMLLPLDMRDWLPDDHMVHFIFVSTFFDIVIVADLWS